MSARSSLAKVKARAVEQTIALEGGQIELGRGLYGRLAAAGISRGEVARALADLEAQNRVAVFNAAAGRVGVRLIGGDR